MTVVEAMVAVALEVEEKVAAVEAEAGMEVVFLAEELVEELAVGLVAPAAVLVAAWGVGAALAAGLEAEATAGMTAVGEAVLALRLMVQSAEPLEEAP